MALMDSARNAVRAVVPLAIRIERKRFERVPSWLFERSEVARRTTSAAERGSFGHVLASKESPLKRGDGYERYVQRAKETNVRRVAKLINGVLIEPGQLFSYHHVVGRPSVLRGFAAGPELREGKLALGVGGGACQVSNMLFQLGLISGLEVVERHRHGLDLFPDVGRDVPFGCGATVFYNMADLRLRNPYRFPVVWRLTVGRGALLGALLSPVGLSEPVEVFETLHRFVQRDGEWWRENRIARRAGTVTEEVVHNLARTAYTPDAVSAPHQRLQSDDVRWHPASDRLSTGEV
jgi:vancomycin resistance protein VanW